MSSKLTIDSNAPKAISAPVSTEPSHSDDGKSAALGAILQHLSGQAPTATQVAAVRARLKERKTHADGLKTSAAAHAQGVSVDQLSSAGSSQSNSPMVGATQGAQTLSADEQKNITNLRQGAVLPRPQAQAMNKEGAASLLEKLGQDEGGWRSHFDGSAWGATLWNYMKNATQDDQKWRRMLKDLQAADSELQQGFKGLEIALTDLKQSQERHDKMLALAQSGSSFSQKVTEGKAQELVGNNPMKGSQKDGIDSLDDTESNPDTSKKLREIDSELSKLTSPATGQAEGDPPVRFLTPSELETLSPEQLKSYESLHAARYELGGMTDKLATLRQDARRRGFDPYDKSTSDSKSDGALKSGEVQISPDSASGLKPVSDMDPEFREMLDDADTKFKVQVDSILRDPRGYAMMRQNRAELARRVDDQHSLVAVADKDMAELKSQLDAAPDAEKPALQEKLSATAATRQEIVDQQEVMLDALVSLDDMMIGNRPGLNTAAFVKDSDSILKTRAESFAKLESGQDSHQRVTDIYQDMIRGPGSARTQVNVPNTLQAESDNAGSQTLSEEQKTRIRTDAASDRSGSQADRISAMKARAEAGNLFHSSDAELFTSYHSESALQQFLKGALQGAVDTWERSAMKQVAEAGAQFGQAEKQAYGMLQKTMGKVQQMVEQVINLQKL